MPADRTDAAGPGRDDDLDVYGQHRWAGPVRRAPMRRGAPDERARALPRKPVSGTIGVAVDRLVDVRMLWRARFRSQLARRAARRRLGALLVAITVAAAVSLAAAAAERDRRAWGATAEVVVMRRSAAPGHELRADDVELRRLPAGMLPTEAVSEDPTGRRLAAGVVAGEVLVPSRLAKGGTGSAAARLSDGSAAVTVPSSLGPDEIAVGDRVDVLAPTAASDDPWGGRSGPVEVVARGAEVIGVRDAHVTLSIRRSELEPTAAAILDGTLTIALTG